MDVKLYVGNFPIFLMKVETTDDSFYRNEQQNKRKLFFFFLGDIILQRHNILIIGFNDERIRCKCGLLSNKTRGVIMQNVKLLFETMKL